MKSLNNGLNAWSLLTNFKAVNSDTLPVGVHLVTIDEFYPKEEPKEKDLDEKKARGYVDETATLVAWLSTPEGRMAHYFHIAGFVTHKELLANVDYWLNQVDPADHGYTVAKWKKLDQETKLKTCFSNVNKYAIYNGKNGPVRITDEKRMKGALGILERFVGAAMGESYELKGLSIVQAIEKLQKDLVGKQLRVKVIQDADSDSTYLDTKYFRKA